MKAISKVCIVIILLATTMVAINFLFMDSQTIPLITKHTGQGFTYYTFDISQYLTNLEANITNTAELELTLPTRQWINTTANITQEQFWADLGNNLALMLDYVIMILNIIIYPLRIGGYMLQTILCFIGLPVNDILMEENTTNKLAWLVNLTEILKILQIPYV